MNTSILFSIPLPILQINISESLFSAQGKILQQALLEAIGKSDIVELDKEAHTYVSKESLTKLAGRGVRVELMFALPSLLINNPSLLGYYRFLLGFSRKEFYSKKLGLSSTAYKNMEDKGKVNNDILQNIPALCLALNNSAEFLLTHLPLSLITKEHLERLTLLTFGPQLRGSHNVLIGVLAVKEVFNVIKNIIGNNAELVEDNLIILRDATDRRIKIRFSSDPDIEVVSVSDSDKPDTPLLAIEVKGGKDRSNVHNRLGEAEKSHLKAKSKGFTDLWTIINIEGLSAEAKKAASPTTTVFFDLEDLKQRKGAEYEYFNDRLLQTLRLPG